MLSFFATSPSREFHDELGHGGRIQLRVSASEDCAQVPFEICCRSAMIWAVTTFPAQSWESLGVACTIVLHVDRKGLKFSRLYSKNSW